MIAVAGRWLRVHLSTLILWLVGLAALAAVYVPLYQRYEAEGLFTTAPVPDGLSNTLGLERLGTPTGFLGATIFGPLGLLLLVAAGITLAAGAIAGEEERGVLDLTVSRGVSRFWVYVGRALACLLAVIGLGVWFTAMVAVAVQVIRLPIPTSRLVAAGVALTMLALLFATIAYAVGAATGRGGLARVVASTIAVGTFVMEALGTRGVAASPFHWLLAEPPLDGGLRLAPVALTLLVCVLVSVGGLVGFLARDLGRWRLDEPVRP